MSIYKGLKIIDLMIAYKTIKTILTKNWVQNNLNE